MKKFFALAACAAAISMPAMAANHSRLVAAPAENIPTAALWHYSSVGETDRPDSNALRVDTAVLGFGHSSFQCNDCPAERMNADAAPLQIVAVAIRF